jgi:molybdenum cofactor guanylyltransferase
MNGVETSIAYSGDTPLSELLTKLPFQGKVETLLANPDRETGLEKQEVAELQLLLSGIDGDCHGGHTRLSDSRMLKQFKRGTVVKNARQVSILSVEELADIASLMGIPHLRPEWVGANLVTRGIPDLTLLPPSSRLQFPSGATIVIDIEDVPCRYPAGVIEKHHPEPTVGFVKAARNKRGLVGWIEREGVVGVDYVMVAAATHLCPRMRVTGVIIAGGRSSRMGREKALTVLAGKALLNHVIERIDPQVTAVVVNANGDVSRFAAFGLSVIADRRPDIGTPLAGLHAALSFARDKGFDAALTVPSDAPFLPRDLASRLAEVHSAAVIAASAGQQHFLTGLWSHRLLEELEMAIRDVGLVRVKDWAKSCGAAMVEWPVEPYDPFFNVNTPDELAEAERIMLELNP